MKYYKVKKGKLYTILSDFEERRRQIKEVNYRISQELGALGVNPSYALFRGKAAPQGWLLERRDYKDCTVMVYPDRRTKIGKEAAKKLKESKYDFSWYDLCTSIEEGFDAESYNYNAYNGCDGLFRLGSVFYLGMNDDFSGLSENGAEEIQESKYFAAKSEKAKQDES